jgi:predicted O-linked N-acetylglucosamine transferase (SPINDLY family)/Tfp pilus assembly protein PilF
MSAAQHASSPDSTLVPGAVTRLEKAARLEAALQGQIESGETPAATDILQLSILLHEARRHEDAERWCRTGLRLTGEDWRLRNVIAVALKALGHFDEATAELERALEFAPGEGVLLSNLGNVLLAQGKAERAIGVFAMLVDRRPGDGQARRMLGLAARRAGRIDEAIAHAETARAMKPLDVLAWVDLVALEEDKGRRDKAFAIVDRAISLIGPARALVDTRIKLLRRDGRYEEARHYIGERITAEPRAAWLRAELARTFALDDRPTASVHYAEALRLAPDDTAIVSAAADNLDRTRGPAEQKAMAAAYVLARLRLVLGNPRQDAKALRGILSRSCDFERAESLGSFEDLGHHFATTGQEAALHYMLGQVSTPAHRRLLVDLHRTALRPLEVIARQTPVSRPPPARRAKVRIGFMSSDLRHHPVAYFAEPLITGLDRSRFEVFCYSWNTGPADQIERRIAASVDTFRKHPAITDRDAAQLIAADGLDILFELGGSTDMNKIATMAWQPAPRQASWLGYPHSAGLETIDRILVDPWLEPPDPALLVEKPFRLRHSWVALHQPGFSPLPAIDPLVPSERTGRVTFGTMNNIYKFNPDLFATWTEILLALPHSDLLFVRPEAGMVSFRDNVGRFFEERGVSRSRLRFVGIRGDHLGWYNAIDVALDTFPQTGGTTTCETLWMGVPVVTLVGEAFFERLSYSNLNNAGLGEWCAFDRATYVALALKAAADVAWRTDFRRNARQRIADHPLGQPRTFIRDFQDAALAWMEEVP